MSTKWRVTFEVDLGGNIPSESELKPHDYPLENWASQAVFDLVINNALLAAHQQLIKYLAMPDSPAREHLLVFGRARVDVCEQAKDSMRVERIS